MRPGLAIGLIFGLGGCLGEGGGGLGFLGSSSSQSAEGGEVAKPLRQASLAGGKVVVAAPRGYCVDRGSLDSRPSGGFALIGSCAALGGAGPWDEPVVMTVQVQRRPLRQASPDSRALADAVAPLRVLAREDGDGISLIHLAEGGDAALPGSDPRHWRGAMMINGHAVALSLYVPEGSSAAGRAGRDRLIALAEAMLEASPIRGYAGEIAAARNAAEDEGEGAQGTDKETAGLRQLFPGLFQ